MVTFLSYISKACHSLSGVAERLQHAARRWSAGHPIPEPIAVRIPYIPIQFQPQNHSARHHPPALCNIQLHVCEFRNVCPTGCTELLILDVLMSHRKWPSQPYRLPDVYRTAHLWVDMLALFALHTNFGLLTLQIYSFKYISARKLRTLTQSSLHTVFLASVCETAEEGNAAERKTRISAVSHPAAVAMMLSERQPARQWRIMCFAAFALYNCTALFGS